MPSLDHAEACAMPTAQEVEIANFSESTRKPCGKQAQPRESVLQHNFQLERMQCLASNSLRPVPTIPTLMSSTPATLATAEP